MDDTMIFLIFESLQNLNGESSYQTEWNSLKIIVLYKLIKINTQAFKCNQKMLPKNNIIFNSDYIILIIFIMMIQKFQYSQFNTRLILKFLFISNNLDSINFLCFVIKTLYSLSKTSLPKKFKDFISICQMILKNNLVITLIVIKSMIEYIHLFQSFFVPLNILCRFIFS